MGNQNVVIIHSSRYIHFRKTIEPVRELKQF